MSQRLVEPIKGPGNYADEIAQLPTAKWLEAVERAPASMHSTIKVLLRRIHRDRKNPKPQYRPTPGRYRR